MDILIISEYCEDFSETDNDRFFYLAKLLAKENDVEVITSTFRHTTKSQRYEPAKEWNFKITFIDEPGYPKNVCLKRLISHHTWGKNVIKYIKKRNKPDVIYCAVPSLSGPNLVAKYCEKEDIRFIIDVQDLWPEAFQMVLNVPLIPDIVFSPLAIMVNGTYKRADEICAVSDSYCKRAQKRNKKVKSTTTVFLGTELATFDRYTKTNTKCIKPSGQLWLGYAGTLGESYDIPCVIDALKKVKNDKQDTPVFILLGDGPEMASFEKYALDNGVDCKFFGRVPYDQMCAMLSQCDMVVNPIIGTSVATILNKHADYAAVGLPVINTQNSAEYKKLVDDYAMGINCESGNSDEVAEAIIRLMENSEERKNMGLSARRCAEEKFDRTNTYKKIVDLIIGEQKRCGVALSTH